MILFLHRIVKSEAAYLLCLFLPYEQGGRAGLGVGGAGGLHCQTFFFLSFLSSSTTTEIGYIATTNSVNKHIFSGWQPKPECEKRL